MQKSAIIELSEGTKWTFTLGAALILGVLLLLPANVLATWSGATCGGSYTLNVTNLNITDSQPPDSVIVVYFDHAGSLLSGNCLRANASDLHIIYNDSYEIDRINITQWNLSNTGIAFPTQNGLSAGASTNLYKIYCNCTEAEPISNLSKIADLWDYVTNFWDLNDKNYIDMVNKTKLTESGGADLATIPGYYNGSMALNFTAGYLTHDYYWNIFNGTYGKAGISISITINPNEKAIGEESYIWNKLNNDGIHLVSDEIAWDSGDYKYYSVYRSGGTDTQISRPAYPNSWQSYLATWGADGSFNSSINGNITYFPATSGLMDDGSDQDFTLGAYFNGAGHFVGAMDAFIVFNKTLADNEIIGLQNRQIEYPNTKTLKPYFSVSVNFTGSPPAPPAPPVINYTSAITFCASNTILYVRGYDVAESGNIVLNERFISCDFGCANSTITALGAPGCKESNFTLMLMLIIAVVLMVALIRWVAQ